MVLLLCVHAAYGRTPREYQGMACGACTAVVGIVRQVMKVHSCNATSAVSKFCSFLPFPLGATCTGVSALMNPVVVPLVEEGESPEVICHAIHFCQDDQTMCHLFPQKYHGSKRRDHIRKVVATHAHKVGSFDICTYIPAICTVFDQHRPAFDHDDDGFSTFEELRGTHWRGKDCNDWSASTYPGKASSDGFVDENCNGIYGMNTTTWQPYEDSLCKGSGAMGVGVLGDSVSLHFHIPRSYVNVSELSAEVMAHTMRLFGNEAGWPMLSWMTGYANVSDYAPDIPSGPMVSVYSKMVQRNKCNHRDYQNIGVNGYTSFDLYNLTQAVARNRTADKPMLLVFAMVGNDICTAYNFENMTKPQEYHDNIVRAVFRADELLPSGSHIVLIPIADARILYNEMHNRIHPLGWVNKDITYRNFYDYFNCVGYSPCWGWMNHEESIRNQTFEVASKLNAQLPIIIAETRNKTKNVKVHYYGALFDQAIKSYSGDKASLIDEVDGFHPSQLGTALFGQTLWDAMIAEGEIIPPMNPHNFEIVTRFGDQGGY